MRLKNKKTGEIGYLIVGKGSDHYVVANNEWGSCGKYKSLAKLNEEWEDAPEEPKKHYELLAMGAVMEREDAEDEIFRNQEQREIGNYFDTREEAEKAVEKLKALANLRKNGFRFTGWNGDEATTSIKFNFIIKAEADGAAIDDLDLLFGGEE